MIRASKNRLRCRWWPVGLVLAGLLCATAVHAEDAQSGDVARGKTAFETCRGCHAIPGYRQAYPGYAVPRLGGQSADYIESALAAYRSGDRDNATMQAQASSLTKQQIQDIAAYLAQAGGGS